MLSWELRRGVHHQLQWPEASCAVFARIWEGDAPPPPMARGQLCCHCTKFGGGCTANSNGPRPVLFLARIFKGEVPHQLQWPEASHAVFARSGGGYTTNSNGPRPVVLSFHEFSRGTHHQLQWPEASAGLANYNGPRPVVLSLPLKVSNSPNVVWEGIEMSTPGPCRRPIVLTLRT